MNTECIILAGGSSSRIGRNKLLLDIGGKTVIERCIGAFYDVCSKIIVVTGRYHVEIKGSLGSYNKIRIIYNKNYSQGMFSSVKTGIKEVEATRFFIMPGDYPLLQNDTIQQMLAVNKNFIAPVYQGKQGHPILLHKLYIPIILSSKEASLRDCLEKTRMNKHLVQVQDAGVVSDMDTSEAYDEILKRY